MDIERASEPSQTEVFTPLGPLTLRVARGLSAIAHVLCVGSAALAFLLPFPIIYEVVMDGLHDPPTWVFETTGYAIIMIAFAASGYGLSTGHHFRVSLLPERFPALARPLARLSAVLQVAFGLVLLVAGTQQVWIDYVQGLRSDTLLAVPQYLPQLAFPIGGIVIALQGFAHILVPPPERGLDVIRE